ncbi:hypothetical protein Tco_0507881, partial [Tanacetum coccineum]
FLAQLESQKDASMADIMDLLRLEGHAAETPEASQLQPSPEQLMVPIHRLEDQVIIGETSLSFSLDVAHVRAQRIRGDTAARRLSLMDAMVPLLEPLSAKSLTGEVITFGFPATTTALSTTFAQASTVPPAPSAEVPPSPKIVFEQGELDTTPEHASAPDSAHAVPCLPYLRHASVVAEFHLSQYCHSPHVSYAASLELSIREEYLLDDQVED